MTSGVLPAGGLIWRPDPDTRLELLFPRPRVARRIRWNFGGDLWAYVLGQFGGGSWAVTLLDDSRQQVLYSDLRALVGVEWLLPNGVTGVLDAGYVFERNLDVGGFSVAPSSTFILRVGLNF